MALINYPTSLDTEVSIGIGQTNTPLGDATFNHLTTHKNIADAIVATETLVGVSGSAVTTTHDNRIATLENTSYTGPLQQRIWFDDFLGVPSGLGWAATTSSGGSVGQISPTDANWNASASKNMGLMSLAMGSSASSNLSQRLSLPGIITPGLGALDITFRSGFNIVPPNSSCTFEFGIQDIGTYKNSIRFVYTNTGMTATCAANNVVTTNSVTFSFVAYAMHTFRISVNAAWTSVAFYIDGTSVSTITTNIPSSVTVGASQAGMAFEATNFSSTATNGLSTQPVMGIDYFLSRYQFGITA